MQDELRRTVDAIPGLAWSARLDGGFDFLNQRWCDYTGLGLEAACDEVAGREASADAPLEPAADDAALSR